MTERKNQDIKNVLKEKHIYQWQLADKLGISEMTLSRKLRYELNEKEKEELIMAIEELAKENQNEGG